MLSSTLAQIDRLSHLLRNSVKKPNDPINGDLLFVGWYFDEDYIDENGNQALSCGISPTELNLQALFLVA